MRILAQAGFASRKFPSVLFEKIIEILDPDPHCAALNMAIDEILLGTMAEPTVRIYSWEAPSVSFGYFSRWADVASQWPERDAVRRWTGGGIVLHGDDITYSLLIPKECPLGASRAADSYRAIHKCVARWLTESGVPADLTAGQPKVSDECFVNPAPHDVMAGTQKISGAAQRRTRAGLLHQGSIQPVPGRLRDRCGALPSAFGTAVEKRSLRAEELSAAKVLAARKYGTVDWARKW